MEKTTVYPELHDRVYIRRPQTGPEGQRPWEKDWAIIVTGINNEHGYPFAARIKHLVNGEEMVVSIFREHANNKVDVLILPPDEEWNQYPAIVNLTVNKDLVVVRRFSSEKPQYEIVCLNCNNALFSQCTSTENGDLYFDPGHISEDPDEGSGFVESGQSMEDSNTVTRCACDNVKYDTPAVYRYS